MILTTTMWNMCLLQVAVHIHVTWTVLTTGSSISLFKIQVLTMCKSQFGKFSMKVSTLILVHVHLQPVLRKQKKYVML